MLGDFQIAVDAVPDARGGRFDRVAGEVGIAGRRLADIAVRYMRDYVPAHCKASSAEVYRRALDIHILPALGEMPVGAVGSEHVSELHYAMRGEPYAANAALKIVGKMLSLADTSAVLVSKV